MLLLWVLCHFIAIIDIAYLCTKFDKFRFCHSISVVVLGLGPWPSTVLKDTSEVLGLGLES